MSEAIIGKLQSLVGAEHAFAAADPRAVTYMKVFGLETGSIPVYVAAARPADVESLQAIVRLAAAEGLEIWSTPNAAGNGARAGIPGVPGLIVDLRRMNRILEVDTKSACALVEPGVSYRQLHAHLAKKNIAIWLDCDREAEHSIAGSICSRQFGFTPYADHLQMQCGMEVILADGQVVRTGMGALPGNNTWQVFKYNFGPYLDGLFTQSDLALVSKVGLWIMPAPPRYRPFMLTLPDQAALEQAIELLRSLKIGGLIGSTVTIASAQMDAVETGPRGGFETDGALDRSKLTLAQDRGEWGLYGALYGAPDNIELSWEIVRDTLGAIAGTRLHTSGERQQDRAWRTRQELMGGQPAARPLDLAAWGGPDHMQLTAAAPMEGAHASGMAQIAARVLSAHQFDNLHEFALTSRTLLMRICLPYRHADAESHRNAVAAAQSLLAELSGAGFGIVDESPELRGLLDRHTGGSPLAGLVQRIRAGLAPKSGTVIG